MKATIRRVAATGCVLLWGGLGCVTAEPLEDEGSESASDGAVAGVYEAEAFTSKSGCNLASNHAGFTGSGFMDYGGNGTWIEWNNINAVAAGTYTLTFRYANGGATRQSAAIVNGQNAGNVPFANTGAWTNWKTDTLKVSLKEGANTIRVMANTGSGGPNLDNMKVEVDDLCPDDPDKKLPGECGCGVPEGTCSALRYEAEDRTSANGCTETAVHAGFTGRGFMDYGGNGTWIEWNNISVGAAGEYTLTFRYANGGATRQSAASVNGQNVGSVPFANTGGWTSWKTDAIKVSLRQGVNTIRVIASAWAGGPNLDNMVIHADVVNPDQCPADPNKTAPGICGCGVPDTDADKDGTADCKDGCKDDPRKTAPGECGCGVADTDANGNGKADCLEQMGAVKVFILAGQSNMVGAGTVTPSQSQNDKNGGMGTVAYLVEHEKAKYGHLVGKTGTWASRDDVWLVDLAYSGPLTIAGATFGPELQFGHVIGDFYDEQVVIIKTSWGGKSLAVDFRPPSSGGAVGPYYTQMVNRVHEVLGNLRSFLPSYDGGGVEIAGFGWHQGWNDRINQTFNNEYQTNCVNLINDLRAEFGAPDMPFVLATTGMSGWADTHPRALSLMNAQLAVPADPRLKAGNVFAVETRDFWRDAAVSPADQGYHWNRNAETYLLIGHSMADAMVDFL